MRARACVPTRAPTGRSSPGCSVGSKQTQGQTLVVQFPAAIHHACLFANKQGTAGWHPLHCRVAPAAKQTHAPRQIAYRSRLARAVLRIPPHGERTAMHSSCFFLLSFLFLCTAPCMASFGTLVRCRSSLPHGYALRSSWPGTAFVGSRSCRLISTSPPVVTTIAVRSAGWGIPRGFLSRQDYHLPILDLMLAITSFSTSSFALRATLANGIGSGHPVGSKPASWGP